MYLLGSYKPCTHPHPPILTHTYPHPAKKRSDPLTPSHTRPRKGHSHSHPAKKRSCPPTPTPNQPKKVIPPQIQAQIYGQEIVSLSITSSNLSQTQEVINIIFAKYDVRQLTFRYNIGLSCFHEQFQTYTDNKLQRSVFCPTVFTTLHYFLWHVYYFVNCA